MSSLEFVFGKWYTNKNLSVELARFLEPVTLSKLV